MLLLIISTSIFSLEIKIPTTSQHAERDSFELGLLALILQKVKGSHTITIAHGEYTQARIIKELKEDSGKINLYWMGTSAALEKDLLPIRIPIYRGLLGHRIFIINRNSQILFDDVKTLSDLQKYSGVQGFGWSDIDILEYSGLKQHPAKYRNIFNMINQGGRIDYFSRAVTEAFSEVSARKDRLVNLAVENNVLLVYPFALFFFTSHANTELAEIITQGFKVAYQDGSFNRYFYNHPSIKKVIAQANMDKRVKIEIANPFITPETNAISDEYWHGKEGVSR